MGELIQGSPAAHFVNQSVRDSGMVGAGDRNAILGNEIYSNTLRGIELDVAGFTGIDPDDLDTGPNELQNYPALTSAIINGAGAVTIADVSTG